MTNNDSFDNHIKKQLGDSHPEVPPHIWENILAKKEKKRPAGFLFFISRNRIMSVVFLLMVFGGSAILLNHSINNNDKTENVSNKINNNLNYTSRMTDQINNSGTNGDISSSDDTVVNVQDNSAVNTDNTQLYGAADNGKMASQKPTRGLKAISDTKVSNWNNSHPGITGTQGEDAESLNTISKNKTAKTRAKSNVSISTPAIESVEDSNNADAIDATDDRIENAQSLNKSFLHLQTAPVEKSISWDVKGLQLPCVNIPCPGAEKNAAGNKRYFEIYGGPDYAFRTFSDTANSNYLEKRKQSTSFTSAFSFGLRYTRVFRNSVSFRTGLNYSQVNEKFQYEQGQIVQQVHLINELGDTTGSYATTGTRYKTTHNRYKTLDIPLMLGYEMGNGRLHTNINGGLVINAYSWQKGDILDSAYNPINITTGKSNSPYQFKTNVGVGFMGAVSFYYKLNNRMHVLAEPYFRYNFSPSNKAEITLKQKYTTVGLRLGMRIDF